MNQVNLIGNLTRDVELRYTTDQKAIARFSIAVDDGYGEQKCRNHRTENTFRTTELISHVDCFLILWWLFP